MSVRSYICPGDTQGISRSVHLARLAADFDGCASCPHREDIGGIRLPPRPARVQTPAVPVLQRERVWRLLRYAGPRQEILDLAAALGAVLWQGLPWELPLNDWDAAETLAPIGPLLAIACDDSATGQAFVSEVIRAISRSGCRVMALGTLSRPALEFAVDHLGCVAGVHVVGGGSPAGIGFSVVGPQSTPWSAGGRLGVLAQAAERGIGRPCRTAGAVRQFDAVPGYRESLVRHFPSIAPPEISVAGMTETMRQVWKSLSERVSVSLRTDSTGMRCDDEPTAAILKPLQEDVVQHRRAGGIVLGADDRRLWVIDRREGLLSAQHVAERIAGALRHERGEREVRVVATEASMWTDLNVPGTRLSFCGSSEEQIVEAMVARRGLLGCDGLGRFWIAAPAPRCDALLALAYVARHWSAAMSGERAVA